MISIHRLIYNGYSSEDFDLCCQLAFDSDSGESNSYLSREAVASETYRGDLKRVHSYKFTESLAPTITFVDKNFGDFDLERQRKVLKWLTSKDTASFLTVYHDDSEVVSYEILGGFTEIQTYKLGNGRVVGFTAVFESVAPWAFSALQTMTKDVTKEIDTTMYYWTSTLVSGTSVPQYLLTQVQTPKIGTIVYSVQSAIIGSIITAEPTFYGAISKINADGSYVVNNTTFKLTQQGTKTKHSYDNKIIINLETDDPQNAVYPRITIQEQGIVVAIKYAMGDQDTWVDGSVFQDTNTNIFYWVDAKGEKHTSTSNTSEFNTTSVSIKNIHIDDIAKVTVFDTLVKKNTGDETVVLDGANRVVSSSSESRIFGDDFSWNWTPLYEGKNELSFVGNCTVTVEYRYPIKCGEF